MTLRRAVHHARLWTRAPGEDAPRRRRDSRKVSISSYRVRFERPLRIFSPPCIPRQLPFRFHETSIIPPCIYNALSAGDEYASHSSLPLRNTGTVILKISRIKVERISANKSGTWTRNSISEKRRCIHFDFSRLIFRNVARAQIFRGKYIGMDDI